MTAPWSRLRTEVDADGVATVTMDRPPVNAVDLLMYRELRDLFVDVDAIGPGVRAVVLTGGGRHFCAGNDLDDFASMDSDNVRERMFHVREAFFAIQECAVPVIGAVAGAALGTGLAVAASCDFVVAADDAAFGLPELSVGVHGGARHLGRLVSQPVVRWMYFTGQRLSGEEMRALGAVVMVVPRDDLLVAARAEARRIAAFSPTAVRMGKKGLNDIEFVDIRRGYEHEQGLTARMMDHPDSKIALHASRNGETPKYPDVGT
ncbi:MAG TPA: enoyl-CoA hydratase-related protein [Acidimicrobiales bacterium]|nr:enoyl-CoA hydratase-related protein [Acidimicrobiales bacterium]